IYGRQVGHNELHDQRPSAVPLAAARSRASCCRWISSANSSSADLMRATWRGLSAFPARKAIQRISRDMPLRMSKPKPTGINNFAGQRISPPVLDDSSCKREDSYKYGRYSQKTNPAAGNSKNSTANTSMNAWTRVGNFVARVSTLTCSLRRLVYPEASMKMAPNRYLCNSSHAFELIWNAIRLTALAA